MEAGRRFKAPTDKGRVRFHDHKKGAQTTPRAKSEIAVKLFDLFFFKEFQ